MSYEIVRKYLARLREYDGTLTVDHLAGFENKKGLVPEHLSGNRYFNYRQGQRARQLRDWDHQTHILAFDAEGNQFSKVYSGRLSHNQIITICEKAKALQNIHAHFTDNATGKSTSRDIGY